jgi:dynein heavy chain, axonemal
MGQGQGHLAIANIKEARKFGYWVFLQNMHLSVSWFKSLERAQEELAEIPLNSMFR